MPTRSTVLQIGISLATTILAIAIGVPPLRRVPLEHAIPLLIAGALFGMSLMRAELALRRRRSRG